MKNISDKNVIIVILATIIVVFLFIFSVKSPERNIIESPIMWKDNLSNISKLDKDKYRLTNYIDI